MAECEGQVVQGLRLRCALLPANSSPEEKVSALRKADVYVCVWGGDTVHALHLPRRSAVIELRSEGFTSGAPHQWVWLHQRWVSRYRGDLRTRPLHFYALALPTNSSVFNKEEEDCAAKDAAKRAVYEEELALSRANATPLSTCVYICPPGMPVKRPPVSNGWLCYWNANLRVSFGQILPTLHEHISTLKLAASGEEVYPAGGRRPRKAGKASNKASNKAGSKAGNNKASGRGDKAVRAAKGKGEGRGARAARKAQAAVGGAITGRPPRTGLRKQTAARASQAVEE